MYYSLFSILCFLYKNQKEYKSFMLKDIVKELSQKHNLSDSDLYTLLTTDKYDTELMYEADKTRRSIYSDKVYIRGLIEFTNYCKNNCLYCGIRCANTNATRYRLTKDDIMDCCRQGYTLGFRTFVLQGGEDPYFTDDIMCDIISTIKTHYPDCAVTLSIGEKSYESYKRFYLSGADRYLLRHETADSEHYAKLHPESMSFETRRKCLFDLKEIGFQVGAGFMVGSPFQTMENIIKDLRFIKELEPHMIGIGPFLTNKDTPFAKYENGSFELTLRLVSILRLMFPYALIPSTTALGTIHPNGREMGLKRGANVVMPNLSPVSVRKNYLLYDNKISTGEEAAECVANLKKLVKNAGYKVVTDIGHAKNKM